MVDIANLAMAVDSKPVVKATEDVDKLTAASVQVDRVTEAMAKRAGISYDEMAKRIANARANMENYSKSIGAVAVATQQAETATKGTSDHLNKIGNVAQAGVHLLGGYTSQLALVGATFGTIGFAAGAAGGAIIDYIQSLSGVSALDKKLEEHATLIGKLKEAYGDALEGVKQYAAGINAVLQFQLGQNQTKQLQEVAKQAREFIEKATVPQPTTTSFFELFIRGAEDSGRAIEFTTNKFKDFTDVFDQLQKGAATGSADIRFAAESIAALGKASSDPATKELASKLLEMIDPAVRAEAALRGTERAMLAIARASAEGLGDIAKFNSALSALAGIAPTQLSDRAQALKAFREAQGAAGGFEERAAAAKAYGETIERIGVKEREEAKKTAASQASTAEFYQRVVERARDRIEELELEAKTAGQTRQAVEQLRIQHELERAAKRGGIEVTDKVIAQQKELAKAYADAAQAARLAQVRADIQFEQRTSFLPQSEVAIASRLRDVYGNDVTSALQSAEAAQMRLNASIRAGVDAATDFASTMLEGLAKGEKAADVLKRALSSLTSTLIRQGTQSLFGSLLGGTGGGNLLSGIGSLFGGGGALQGPTIGGATLDTVAGGGGLLSGLGSLFGGGAAAGGGAGLLGLGAAGGPVGLGITAALVGGSMLFGNAQANRSAARDRRLQIWQAMQEEQERQRQLNEQRIATVTSARAELAKFGADPESDIASRLKEINAAAAKLAQGLSELGMSTQEVTDGVAKATAALREEFIADLEAKVNTATNKGYLNELRDLIKERDTLLADAASLGVGRQAIDTYFKAQAQKIVDGADLVGSSVGELIDLFPELAGVISGFGGRLTQITNDIQAYLDELRGGGQSPLSPQARLASAQEAFGRQFSLAQSGDSAAIGSITQYSSRFLDAARDYFGSSSGYQDIFNQVTSQLTGLPATLAGGGIPTTVSPGGGAETGGPMLGPVAAAAFAATQGPTAANDNAAGFNALHADLGNLAMIIETLTRDQTQRLEAQLIAINEALTKSSARSKLDAEDPRLYSRGYTYNDIGGYGNG